MNDNANPLTTIANLIAPGLPPEQQAALKVGLVVMPLAIAGGVVFYVWWSKRKAAPPAAPAVGAAPTDEGQVERGQLRRAWRRFEKQLPPRYRRSLLNFEHFVVLGAPASGKSRIIDEYSDWRRKAKEIAGSQPHDPDLPVYLASGAVLVELPGRFLTDHSARAQQALRDLWEPIYSRRAPTVVVAVDARKLKENPPEVLAEQAESVRARVNQIAAARGRPIEVRVVLTHLDSIPGFTDFAGFCREQNIPAFTGIAVGDELPEPSLQLNAWIEGLRDHLPRALTHLPSASYLRVVTFLRQIPSLVPPLSGYLTSLFARMAMAPTPISGGVYLASTPPGISNPLERAAERGPGPDPRRWHLLVAAMVTGTLTALAYTSYRSQRALYLPALADLNAYDAAALGADSERARRLGITTFAYRNASWLDTTPDYFSDARVLLRKKFSDKVRNGLLIQRLTTHIASIGTTADSNLALPTRRSLYYLTLTHSDKNDRINIGQSGRIEIWSRMTGLPQDLIRDYLASTDEPLKIPVTFDLNTSDSDLVSTWQVWPTFLRRLNDAIRAGAVDPLQLAELQNEAARLATSLDRYEHDDLTAKLLGELDGAAGTGAATPPPLRDNYGPKFSDYQRGAENYPVLANRERLKSILRVVRAGAVSAQGQQLLRTLVERLGLLYEGSGAASDDDPVQVMFAGEYYTFRPQEWRKLLRDSTGRETIQQFLREASRSSQSIFFDGQETELRPVVWNPTNDGSAIFTGRALIAPQYTKTAYDQNVRAVIMKLGEALDRAKVPRDQRTALEDFVRERVRRYAIEYRTQLVSFVQSYGLQVRSVEGLRVAMAQMAKPDPSAFNDFIDVPDTHSRLDITHPLLEPMRLVVDEFTPWRAVVKGEGGAPEIAKYRAILAQLLTDLGPPEGAAAEAPQGPETLERALTPVGRLVLSEVRGDKGSYGQLVNEWLLSVRLHDYQRTPFIVPFSDLTRLGRRDIERVVSNAWERELLPEVRRIVTRFPFDTTATDDVSPAELTDLFHPQTGRYFDVFRRYFEPLSDFGQGGPFRARPSLRGRVTLPPQLFELTNSVAALSARLWDPAGKPAPLQVRVATVPFEHGKSPRLALTLVYLNVGSSSLFNFNQKPAQVTMPIDWTRESTSQVGLQLTNVDTKDNVFVEPQRADNSVWSFLRLLQKAQSEPARAPAGAQLTTWTFKIVSDELNQLPGQFVVLDDLWGVFSLGPYVRARIGAEKADKPTTAAR